MPSLAEKINTKKILLLSVPLPKGIAPLKLGLYLLDSFYSEQMLKSALAKS